LWLSACTKEKHEHYYCVKKGRFAAVLCRAECVISGIREKRESVISGERYIREKHTLLLWALPKGPREQSIIGGKALYPRGALYPSSTILSLLALTLPMLPIRARTSISSPASRLCSDPYHAYTIALSASTVLLSMNPVTISACGPKPLRHSNGYLSGKTFYIYFKGKRTTRKPSTAAPKTS